MRSLLIFALVSLVASTAAAAPDDESALAPATRPMWVSLGFGPSIGIVGCVRRLCNLEQAYTQFIIGEDFGYHVSGNGEGFAIGAGLQQAFGSDVYRFSGGLKMWWDFAAADDLGIYIAPMLHLGYSLLHFDFDALGSITDHVFNAQAGLEVRMVLLDRAMVYARPVTADLSAGEDGVSLFYDIMVGGGVTF